MEKSKVYFTDFRTFNGVGLPEKLSKLLRKNVMTRNRKEFFP